MLTFPFCKQKADLSYSTASTLLLLLIVQLLAGVGLLHMTSSWLNRAGILLVNVAAFSWAVMRATEMMHESYMRGLADEEELYKACC